MNFFGWEPGVAIGFDMVLCVEVNGIDSSTCISTALASCQLQKGASIIATFEAPPSLFVTNSEALRGERSGRKGA